MSHLYCETSCERLPCGIPTSAECFEASLPHLTQSSRAPLISSTSLARGTHHHVLGIALLRPNAAQFFSTFSLCGSVFTPCGTSSGTSAPVSLCCLVTLGCSVRLPLAMLFLHGSLGPKPGCFFMGPWTQSLAVLLSSRPFGTCFIHHIQRFQCQLLPQNHGCRSIREISSILSSQASGTYKPQGRTEITIFRNAYRLLVTIFHAQLECPLHCRCTGLWHLHSVE